MIVRGVEGGCIPSLSQPSRYFHYFRSEEISRSPLVPKELGIDQTDRSVAIPQSMNIRTLLSVDAIENETESQVDPYSIASHAAKLGIDALSGEPGTMRDSLIYGASICMAHCGKFSNLKDSARHVRSVLDDGSAYSKFAAASSLKQSELSYGAI